MDIRKGDTVHTCATVGGELLAGWHALSLCVLGVSVRSRDRDVIIYN
jgi:hypothetical protein